MLIRTQAPPVSEIQNISIKKATSLQIEQVPLHILRAGIQPLVRLEFIFKAGSYYEHKPGLSYLCAKMLSEGTTQHTSTEIAELIASLGGFLEIHQGHDTVNVTFFLLEKHLVTLMPLVFSILLTPSFPQKDLDSLKNITIQNLKVNREKGQFLSSIEFRKVLFGPSHPYSWYYKEEDIQKINREELIEFHKENFGLGNVEVFVSGMFNEESLLNLFEVHLLRNSSISGGSNIGTVPIEIKTEKVLIEKPDFLQSSIRIGKTCPTRKSPDFPTFAFLNEILGGFFGSRLMKNIREDKGYTYGIHSSMQAFHHAAYFVVSTDVKKENTSHTIQEVWREMEVLKSELVRTEEMGTVKAYMLGKFINSINTPFALMDKFKSIHFGGLGYEYYDYYLSQLQEINAEKILDLARTSFIEDDFCQVVVGGFN